MNTAVINENKNKTLEAICGYSAKGAWVKIRQLKAKYGTKELARLTGLSEKSIMKYCSADYMKKHAFRKSTWEKYFGEWGLKDPVFPNANQIENEADAIIEAVEQEKEIMVLVDEKPVEEKPAEEKVRLILEVPKLEMLEEALKRFGFRMIIE